VRRLARLLLIVGIPAAVFGLSKYHAEFIGQYDFTESSRFAWAIAYCGILLVVCYGLGLPDLPRSVTSGFLTSVVAAGLAALAISSVQLVVGDALLPRFVVFGAALLVVPLGTLCVGLSSMGDEASKERDRVVVVGDDDLVRELEAELRLRPERPAAIVSSLTVEEAADVSGEVFPLMNAVVWSEATVVVLGAAATLDERIVDQAAELHESGVRVRTRSLFYEEWLGKIPIHDLGRVSLFFDIGEIHRDRYGRLKRVFDVVVGIVGLIPLVALLPIVLIGNVIANRGPLFFVQDRVGRSGTVFAMYKFRTMRENSAVPTEWTAASDPRVTRFGKVLRVTHLDELPQVVNILRGDLSLVGPRPEQPRYVAELQDKLPFYNMRHIVRPGLTGWAQVKYGYAGDERDALEKLQYDFHYLRRQSFAFDLRIVARTIRAVIGRAGR
jgi:lipopolysaccharide/colanic/teichoic acid biosynthesis glycosyltransferase